MIPESKEDERKCHRKGDFADSTAHGTAGSGAGLGHEHLSPLTRLMVYPYVLDSLVSFGSCFRFWCGTEEGLCYTAFSPLLLGLQRAVMLQA